jgi:hypothetical protein
MIFNLITISSEAESGLRGYFFAAAASLRAFKCGRS